GLVEHADKRGVDIDLAVTAGDLRHPRDHLVDRLLNALRLAAGALDQVGTEPLIIIHESLQKVLGQHTLVSLAHRDGLCGLKEATRPFRELFHVHRPSPFPAPGSWSPTSAARHL